MAQQNQPMPEFPPKRKRGRPRKYDAPQSEPYGQYQPPEPNASIYSDQFLSLYAPRNLLRTPNVRLPASVSRDGPIQGLEIPNEVGLAGKSSLRSHSSLVQHNKFQTSASGSWATQAQSNAHFNAGFPTDGGSRSHLNQDKPPKVDAASSGASRQLNWQASSIHGPYSLQGQTVTGTLNEAVGNGYRLTVQVVGTGVVLKGMVYDRQFFVPPSVEIDNVASVPDFKYNGNASSASEALNLKPICSPILSAFKLETATAPQKKEFTPPCYPVSLGSDTRLTEVASDPARSFRGISYFDIVKSLEGEVQTDILQPLSITINNRTEKSKGEASKKSNLDDAEPDTTLKLAFTKEISQVQLDETKFPYKSSRIDKDKMEIEKSFKDEASEENVDDFETVESLRDIKVSDTTLKLAFTKEISQVQLDETKFPYKSSRIDKDKMEIEKSFKDEASEENVDDFETVESLRDIKVSEEDRKKKK